MNHSKWERLYEISRLERKADIAERIGQTFYAEKLRKRAEKIWKEVFRDAHGKGSD